MATYSQRSLNQIIAEFQEIATQHRFINSFACGTQDDFATSGDTQYPAMWVRNEGVTVDRKVQNISFAVLMIDRVKKDRSNMQEVLSDTVRTLSDFRIQIEQPAYGWEVSFSESTPVYEEYMEDEVAGWETNFTITQPFVNDVCAIPFIVPPTPTNGWTAGGGNTDWPNYVPTSRILTINGTAYDLSADRSWTITASGGTWGSITGTLSNQTDLQNALNAKENSITAGTNLQYWRGDKTWQTLDTSVVTENTNLYYTNARADARISAAIGVSVQAYDADLTSWAAITRAAGFDTFTTTPSSANLASLITDETGTGSAVFSNAPTLVNPVVGTQAAGNNSTTAASTAFVDTAINGITSVWRKIQIGNVNIIASIVTASDVYWGTFQSNTVMRQNVASNLAPAFIYLKSSDYPNIEGKAAKLRLYVSMCAVNDVGPGRTITVGLYPCSGPTLGSTGGTGIRAYASGSVVTGSNTISFASPAADSMTFDQATSAFSFPADGLYGIGFDINGAFSANSTVHILAELQLHYE